jgi:pimeloyl-ACP methyl ester carboxylesterase
VAGESHTTLSGRHERLVEQAHIHASQTHSDQVHCPGLHVYRIGAGEPLVLLHGLGESHIGWRPVIWPLSDEYDVIAIDLPGFGRSPTLARGVSPNAVNVAHVIENTLDGLGIDKYHVAGYSLGARVAIQLAKSMGVQSVIAIAPGGLGTPVERIQSFLALLAGRGPSDGTGTGRRLVPSRPDVVSHRHPQPALADYPRRRQAAPGGLREVTGL